MKFELPMYGLVHRPQPANLCCYQKTVFYPNAIKHTACVLHEDENVILPQTFPVFVQPTFSLYFLLLRSRSSKGPNVKGCGSPCHVPIPRAIAWWHVAPLSLSPKHEVGAPHASPSGVALLLPPHHRRPLSRNPTRNIRTFTHAFLLLLSQPIKKKNQQQQQQTLIKTRFPNLLLYILRLRLLKAKWSVG